MSSSFRTLAIFETIAVFEGVTHIPCQFMTMQCPNHCGHAKDVAKFRIDEYQRYEKVDKYGDPQTDYFSFNMNAAAADDPQSPDIIATVRELKAGDRVRLHWNHIYTTGGSVNMPQRRVLLLEKIENE